MILTKEETEGTIKRASLKFPFGEPKEQANRKFS